MKCTPCLAFAALALVANVQTAQAAEGGFGSDGQVIISGERLFGLSFTSESEEDGATHDKTSTSNTNISLLWPNLAVSPYLLPHAAVDFVVASGFTVGGSIGFGSSSSSRTSEPNGGPKVERDGPTLTQFTLQPRVGYALPLGDTFAFWPRLGITYYSIKSESTSTGATPTTSTSTISGLGLDIEAMFVYTPIEHFGITLTPLADIPLSGTSQREASGQPTPPEDKDKFTNFGALVGILGYI